MQVQIKFTSTGSNSVYGSFEAGDLMRCSAELAEHFVKQGLAIYVEKNDKQHASTSVEKMKRPREKIGQVLR